MTSDNHPTSRCPACQRRRKLIHGRLQPQLFINNDTHSETSSRPAALHSSQSRDSRRITHHRHGLINVPAGPIHPAIDCRRWETPLPLLDDQEEEDSRKELQLWREEDLVHGRDITFAGPDVPPMAFAFAALPVGTDYRSYGPRISEHPITV
ncbi:hypothetical protein E2P81_ATG10700 [Venturia nashicola]|nr:hypothetical protein E2P81_ATG10700 [Venturia nashicola]